MIEVGKQCLKIKGEDTFILSGAFHYLRCPKSLWRDRLAKIKAAGLNCIDYCVHWNYHEPNKPRDVNDYSQVDVADFAEFLSIVHDEFGLYSIARPGPYTCAEIAGGGFPWWLLMFKPEGYPEDKQWVRSDDPTYLAWSKHWFDAICPVIAREQLTHKPDGKGGVILFQIENEYDFFPGVAEEQRVTHLKFLASEAKRHGINVPLITCWTSQCRGSADPELKDIFDGPNLYPRWNMQAVEDRIALVKKQQPDAPAMIPELQGGWFSGVGGVLSEDQEGLEPEQIHHITLMSMMHGATILNYYMFTGGTNFDMLAARGITATYDYDAPIREHGGTGPRYEAVKAIGEVLATHGGAIAGSTMIDAPTDGVPEGAAVRVRRSADGSHYLFVRNGTTDPKQGTASITLAEGLKISIDFQLQPRQFDLYYLPENAKDAAGLQRLLPANKNPIARPKAAHSIRLSHALRRPEAETGDWLDIDNGISLPQLAIYDSRTVLYRARREFSADDLSKYNTLWFDLFQDDNLVLNVNGKFLFPTGNYRNGPAFDVSGSLREGPNDITILHENKGQAYFGARLEALCGIRRALLTTRDHLSLHVARWRVKRVDDAEIPAAVSEGADDSTWQSFTLDSVMADRLAADLQPGTETAEDAAARILFRHKGKAIYRSTIEMSAADLSAGKTRLVAWSVEEPSEVYINGQYVGPTPPKPAMFRHDLSQHLRAGRNTLCIIVDNQKGFQAGLMSPVYLEGQEIAGEPVSLQLLPELTGSREKWWSDEAWLSGEKVSLDMARPLTKRGHRGTAPSSSPETLANWYRVEFNLPPRQKSIWTPWHVRLDASGNGFVYLNGHCLGRYWEAGPQRDYYLPDNYLNFGGKNVLTLCVRSTQRGAMLRAVEILNYPEFAEWR